MTRRPHRRYAVVALLIAALMLSGARIGAIPSSGIDGFAFCSAVKVPGEGGTAAPGDTWPSGGHAGSVEHCPLCATAAAAAPGRIDVASAALAPAADPPALAPTLPPPDGRALERVRPQPPPARG